MHVERERHTIMDGLVVEFARSFDESEGIFGPRHEAQGPYLISASRNAVVVHRAELTSTEDAMEFSFALGVADMRARQMTREDRGNYKATPIAFVQDTPSPSISPSPERGKHG